MKKTTEVSVQELFAEVERLMNEDPAPYQELDVVYQFELKGEEEGTYQLKLSQGKARVKDQPIEEADCRLQMKVTDFKKLITGQLKGTTAFMLGKLKVKGNIGLALKLDQLLEYYAVD
ncbi:putative sterol carrier protein [Pullulanibacillus pueri]|uniref:SCP2 domain-containing protein n=1 Tax=Pullulanibacillus pueri TaxID=1437324 RepID=A0A8J3EMZ4_9BACL|nr:SCP2 sterol-binding domain-containing protein [Pullulanibacillus pueri]MBM7684018.1 putative sterol carrier protein [Pullulanibacillus pueri]GGH85072.1 hypothetical protein GCM10007096_29610 [Pullulanibacillus pueri]